MKKKTPSARELAEAIRPAAIRLGMLGLVLPLVVDHDKPPKTNTKNYPKEGKLTCKRCGGRALEFKWMVKNYRDEISQAYGHPGFGYEFDDSYIRCVKCKGKWVPYGSEEFPTIKWKKSKSRKR